MSSIYDWSTTASDNDDIDSAIVWSNTMSPASVDDSARAMMGRTAEFINDIGGALDAGGTANAITVTANSSFTSYSDGMIVAFTATAGNTGATTLSVNGIGAKSIRKYGDAAIAAGDIEDGGVYVVRYNSSANSSAGGWMLQNPGIAADSSKLGGQAGSYYLDLGNATGTLNAGTYSIDISGNAATATDADTLDGQEGSYYARVASPAFTGDMALTDDTGSPQITLRDSSGIRGSFYHLNDAAVVYQRTGSVTKDLVLNSNGVLSWNGNTVWHAGNDGASSGLDSDLLDGQHGSYYLDVDNATGSLAVANGGTGATTASAARTALGLDKAFTKSFESSEQTITSGGLLTLAHSLGVSPKIVTVSLVCKTAQADYAAGDEISVTLAMQTGTSLMRGCVARCDATNVKVRFASSVEVFQLFDSDGNAVSLTNSNFKLVVRAYA